MRLVQQPTIEGTWQGRVGKVTVHYNADDARPEARRIAVQEWASGEVEIRAVVGDGRMAGFAELDRARLANADAAAVARKVAEMAQAHLVVGPDADLAPAREAALMLRERQFFVQDTGGGCEAWERAVGQGHYVWITDEDGGGLPVGPDDPVQICVYGPNGGFVGTRAPDLRAALAAIDAEALPLPSGANDERTVDFADFAPPQGGPGFGGPR